MPFHTLNLGNVETIAKVKKVHAKKNGAHTVVLVLQSMNQYGMMMTNYACVKMPEAPDKGKEFTMTGVTIEQSDNGVNWLKTAD